MAIEDRQEILDRAVRYGGKGREGKFNNNYYLLF